MPKVEKIEIIKKSRGRIIKLFSSISKNFISVKESYLSEIGAYEIRAWKKQIKSKMFLIVLKGKVKFVLYKNNSFKKKIISAKEFRRIFIPKNTWYGFKNMGRSKAMILSLMSQKYTKNNILQKDLKKLKFNWKN
tara:strand:+ start:460 stop:864 length:405 start_codon:yes stop_codon:yes gene_type:complete